MVAKQVIAARVYLRVSTHAQDLTRQETVLETAKAAGYYIAGVYREVASGASMDRPELNKLISDLQPGDVIIAERMDRISRLPIADAERLIAVVESKGAKIAVPGIVDLDHLMSDGDPIARIVMDAVQKMILRLTLQMARDDYEARRERQRQGIALAKTKGRFKGRQPDQVLHKRVIALRESGQSISNTSLLADCSISQVKRIWAQELNRRKIRS